MILFWAVNIVLGLGVFIDAKFVILLILFNLGYSFVFYKQREQKLKSLTKYVSDVVNNQETMEAQLIEESQWSLLQSEIYKLGTTLKYQNKQLNEKQVFIVDSLNDIAHQLKTPLTSMMVMVDLMQEQELPYEKRKQFVDNLERQLERLRGLISKVLTLSKLEANVINYKPKEVLDSQIIEDVIHPFIGIAELKEVNLEVEVSNETVFTDEVWTVEAISNLVKNGLEYSPKHSTLKVKSEVTPLYWKIQVIDQGPGIPKEELDHIFTRFFRGQQASNESVGIGLSLSRRIITQQEGTIMVSSVENEGTTFTIQFYQPISKEKPRDQRIIEISRFDD